MTSNKINQKKAYALALAAVLFWSTMSSAFKITLRFIPFDQLLLWSSLFGIITLFIINQLSNKRLLHASSHLGLWYALQRIQGHQTPL